ncbi:MAG: putative 2OG-Fe(II) oxygenase [Pseudomonadota bacterium]
MTPAFDQQLAAAQAAPDLERVRALGLRALEERREEDAVALVAQAAERAPGDAVLLHILGLHHRAAGDLAPAIAAFDRALALTPDSPRLLHARARAAFEAGLPSLDWFARTRQAAPSDGDVILGHAAAMLGEGKAAEADSLLATMLREHPGWMPGHAALVRLRYAAGDIGQHLAELDRAIAGAPGDPRLHHLKIMVLHRAGLGQPALAAFAATDGQFDEVPEMRAAAAIVATEYGALRAADTAFETVDPFSEPDLAAHWLRHLLRRGEPERVSALADAVPPAAAGVIWPYLSIAWRLTGDPRAAWLDRDEFVKTVDFDDLAIAPLADRLRSLHVARHQPLDQSVRGGTQTDGPLLSRLDSELRDIRARLAQAVSDYAAALPAPDPAHPLLGRVPRHPRFVGSWSVRLTGGGFHEPHIHTEGWLSSAFYVALPQAGEPGAGWLTLGEPQASLGLGLPPVRTVEPRPGRLVLFPSTLWHGTRRFDAGERLTIAFDIA